MKITTLEDRYLAFTIVILVGVFLVDPAVLAEVAIDEVAIGEVAIDGEATAGVAHVALFDEDFLYQGEFVGQRSVENSEPHVIGLQVVSRGGADFTALHFGGGLPGADWDRSPPLELVGRRNGSMLVFAGAPWAIMAKQDRCVLLDHDGQRIGELQRIHRASPTLGATPPEGAMVLFDGRSVDKFTNGRLTDAGLLKEGADLLPMFQDFNLHLEFMLPYMSSEREQGRGNSGVYLQSRYELQILDSFGLLSMERDCGALYKLRKPDVNMCLPPLTWQTYDIVFTAPRWASDGSKLRHAHITAWHNGVKIHDDVEIPNKTGAGKEEAPTLLPIRLQDHDNPVRFRNIWIVDRGLVAGEFPPSVTDEQVEKSAAIQLSDPSAVPDSSKVEPNNGAGVSALPTEGFTALLNGKDLGGWHGQPHFDPRELAAMDEAVRDQQIQQWTHDAQQHWTMSDGELVNDGEGAYLTTDQSYGDVEFFLEYKTAPLADSGIYLRGTPQVQIWDYTEAGGKWDRGADKGSGGLFNNDVDAAGHFPLTFADKPFGEWNRFRVMQIGDRTSVWLNGRMVVDHAPMQNYWDRERPLISRGPIQLQTHGGEIRWRNLLIREVPIAEANERLMSYGGDNLFESIFNGQDLTGWQGAMDSYEVIDGALVCKNGQSGNLFTTEEYGDFVVRLEFRSPKGGNNGLAIRYPGEGNAHLDGLCEIQMLYVDPDKPGHQGLDPRQYHGSIYGLVPAQRGYLREPGQWNFQQVTVVGSQIRVELNGYTIVDADIGQVEDRMGDKEYRGIDRKTGYFGLAGHYDPVAFRNVRIKRLDATAD